MVQKTTKKLIIALILFFIGCDITLLCFAATDPTDATVTSQQQQLQEIQQFQQQNQQATSSVVSQPAGLNNTPPVNSQAAQTTADPPPLPPASQVVTSSSATNIEQATPGAATPNNPATDTNGVSDSNQVSANDVREQAFESMAQSQLPMSPAQIERLRQLFDQSQFAAAAPAGIPPRPTATSEFVNLAPGTTPPVVRLAQGFVSSLVFIDATGAPWPIVAYDIGNPNAFNIQWNKTDNTLMIQALTPYTFGNLAVRLQGLSTPVMLTLIPGQRAVDYRVDLRIQATGPNAVPVPVTGLPGNANPELLGVLDGIPPQGSTEVQVSDSGVQAWLRNDQLFVRTHYTILSPAWIATMSSADGTKAYQMPKAPLLLASEDGRIVQLKIEGL